jgi:uncharacterized small protein (DUF1192 family)
MHHRLFLSKSPENIQITRRALDEIQRLRAVLQKEHASNCNMLRADVACDCGCMTTAAKTLLESCELRAQVETLEGMLAVQRREIARLDLELARRRAPLGTPAPPALVEAPAPRRHDIMRGVLVAAMIMMTACRAPRTELRLTHCTVSDVGQNRINATPQ